MAPCLVTVANFFLLREMALSSKTEPRIKLENNKFPWKVHTRKMASWKGGQYEDRARIYVLFVCEG